MRKRFKNHTEVQDKDVEHIVRLFAGGHTEEAGKAFDEFCLTIEDLLHLITEVPLHLRKEEPLSIPLSTDQELEILSELDKTIRDGYSAACIRSDLQRFMNQSRSSFDSMLSNKD